MLSGGTATFPVTLTAAGSQTITASAMGLSSGSAALTVGPGQFAGYNVGVDGPSTVTAGSNFLVTVQAADAYGNPITNYSGPGSVTATISPTSTASNFPQTVSINSFGLGFFLANLQKVGTYTITVGVGSPPMAPMGSAGPLTVVAGEAVKLAFVAQPSPPPPQPPASIPTGITLPAVSVAIEDVYGNVVMSDSTDNVTVAVATGPGGFLAGTMATEQAHNGIATFNNLTLVTPGNYTLSDIVPGSYIGPNSNSFNIAPLQVSSITPSPAGSAFASGFALTFNAPFYVNTTILNPLGGANVPALYGSGFGAGGIKPSITVTQMTGAHPNGFTLPYNVAGSLVLNPATYSLSFIPTNNSSYLSLNGTPVLPDGTYVVDVGGQSAGVTGFQAFNAGGGYLDGNMPNGDWTATFTVGAAATNDEVVWLPATAIGPGQALEAPGYTLSGGGEPLYLYDPSVPAGNPGDVTSVTGTLTYNPSYLTVTSGMGGPYLTITQTATPGIATFAYNGPPVTFTSANGLNIHNTGIASTPLGYLNWSGALAQLSNSSLGSVVGAPGGNMTGAAPNGTTYYYELASVANGVVSPASTVVSVTVPANDSGESVLLYWLQDLVATGYNLYRTTTTMAGVPQFTNQSLLAANIPYSADPTFGYQYLDATAPGATLMTGALPPPATSFAQATVPNGTAASSLSIYQAKDVLTVSGVTVMAGASTLPSIGNSAVHLVAYEGDADGNGVYTSGGDAVELTRVHLQTDSGFPAYPLIDPVILGDVDNPDLGVFSGDAAFQISTLSVGSTPNFVAPKPTSVQVSPGGQAPYTILLVGNGEDPTLTLPSNLQVEADGTVVVPVNIDDARPAGSTGLVEADLALTYNPSLFTVSASDVHAGSVLAGGNWSVLPTIDEATGQIGIVLSSSTPVSAPTGGSLVTIDFHPVEASGGRQPPGYLGQAQFALVAFVTPNGQYFTTGLEDTQGAFILTPAPTNSFDPRIDGVVMLTANPGAVVTPAAAIAPVEFRDPVSRMVDTLGTTASVTSTSEEATTPNSPAVVSESTERSLLAGPSALADTTMAHAFGVATGPGRATAVAAVSALLSTGVGALAAPLASWTFLVGNVPPFMAAGTGISAGQPLADQVFQTPGAGTINPTLFATVNDVFERVLAGQLMLSPFAEDNLHSQWDEVYGDLDYQGIALGGSRARGELTAHAIAPPTVIEGPFANQDAMDRYFAQIADDADQGTGGQVE